MAPTRELVQQIADETKKFAKQLDFKVFSVVGGENIDEQMFRLRMGVHILIATPGRMNDCLESRLIVLNQCNYVVLDEARLVSSCGLVSSWRKNGQKEKKNTGQWPCCS